MQTKFTHTKKKSGGRGGCLGRFNALTKKDLYLQKYKTSMRKLINYLSTKNIKQNSKTSNMAWNLPKILQTL